MKLTRLTGIALGLALALTAAAAYVFFQRETIQERIATAVEIGGPFKLASSNGGFVDSKDLAGKPYGVFFGFTHCPEVCPTTLYEMSGALAELDEEARDFRLFFITVDPERDTAAMLKDYLSNFDPRIEALVPTIEELPAITRSFRAIYQKVPTSDGSYTMDHTALSYLFDPQGRVRVALRHEQTVDDYTADVQALLAESAA